MSLATCNDGLLAERDQCAAIAFDGRIDNRQDLKTLLGAQSHAISGDAALALRAFEHWGEDFCDHIVGDFSCAVWDGASQTMLLVCDPGALRPLFYWLGVDEILFASEQRGLWCEPRVPKVLDEDQMAYWLARRSRDPSRSFYKDILRVPPGYLVVWKSGQHQLKRYWRPENIPPLRLKRDEDYVEVLRTTFEEAVRCRIDDDGPIGSHLSGGLDSSSVTALAARQLALSGRSLTAFTAVPRASVTSADPGRFGDEGPKAAALARVYPNIEHVLVPNITRPLVETTLRREAAQDWPILGSVSLMWLDSVAELAARRQIKTILTGSMGNITVSYDGLTLLPRLARQLRWAELTKTMWQLHRRTGHRWVSMLGWSAASILPPPLAHVLKTLCGRSDWTLYDHSFINPALLKQAGLDERACRYNGALARRAGWDPTLFRLAMLDRSDHRGHSVAATRRLFGVEMRDPTSDRRVTELCLSIPEEQYLHQGESRSLIRRAMAGLVPDEILHEKRRGEQSADWFVAVDAAHQEFVDEVTHLEASPLAQKCLDMPRLRRLVEDWPRTASDRPDIAMRFKYAVPFALSAGRFIRRIEGGNA